MTRSLPGKKDSWMGMTRQGEISSSAIFARAFPIVNNSDRLLRRPHFTLERKDLYACKHRKASRGF